MRITNKYILFWGGILSNFYPYASKKIATDDVKPLNFKAEGIEWKTSEQYFMYKKAMFFGDLKTADLIKQTIRPEDAKSLGRKVKNFDEEKWRDISYQFMFEAVYAKFSQNNELKQFLLQDSFKNKHFVEASPFDKIWGIGLHYNDKKCDNASNWEGLNKLGQVLDDVRAKLLTNQ